MAESDWFQKTVVDTTVLIAKIGYCLPHSYQETIKYRLNLNFKSQDHHQIVILNLF